MMIVQGHTAAIVGAEPTLVHQQFFATVVLLHAQWIKDGRPLSNQGY